MSVYNGNRYLRAAIESILTQTFTDFEFIIIDDGSSDDSVAIIKSYHDPRIVLVRNEHNLGLTRSLNKGLRLARGRYIARQDADDISLPQRLQEQTDFLHRHEAVGLLGTNCYFIDHSGKRIGTHIQPAHDTHIRWRMLFNNAFCHSSVLIRREFVENRKMRYDETLSYSQDYALWAKLLPLTRVANLSTPLIELRQHPQSVSRKNWDQQQEIATRIAASVIRTTIPETQLTISEIKQLRNWYCNLPALLTEQDITPCFILLRLLRQFSKSHHLCQEILRKIKTSWTQYICQASQEKTNTMHTRIRYLYELLRTFPVTTTHFIARRIYTTPKAASNTRRQTELFL